MMAHLQTVKSELWKKLRKLDFPYSVQFALTKIEELCTVSRCQPQLDLASEIISEFVFFENRGRSKRLSHAQQLHLQIILLEYFTLSGVDEAGKNAVFMLLFNSNNPQRSNLLFKFVALAIFHNNSQVLRATAVQMQQQSCLSEFSLHLAKTLVDDNILLMPSEGIEKLVDLPKIAPLFTANFITSVAEMYYNPEKFESKKPPNKMLLQLITSWVTQNNNLCMTALVENLQCALPVGAIPMTAIAPYAGLIKLCVLSPLYETDSEAHQLYAQLHLCILKSLLENKSEQKQSNIVSVQSLLSIITFIKDNLNSSNEDKVDKSLNWFSQALCIVLCSGALYGNKEDLIVCLNELPYNTALDIVMRGCALVSP